MPCQPAETCGRRPRLGALMREAGGPLASHDPGGPARKHTWSLNCSAFLRSSSTCSNTSLSFFSARRTCLQAAWRSLRGTDAVAQGPSLRGSSHTPPAGQPVLGPRGHFLPREALRPRRATSTEHPRSPKGGAVTSPVSQMRKQAQGGR